MLWNYGLCSHTTEINELLAASYEMLTCFRVRAGRFLHLQPSHVLTALGILDLAGGVNLTNVGALEEPEFNVDHMHHAAHALQT